jgi:glycosyltransferase involved in cell wall biosynthesis
MKPVVSIIVPVYNVELFLPQCIESLVNQTYCYLQIILVNDGSTDNSLVILNEYAKRDSRILLINKENSGVSSARNSGLNAVDGDYVMFVDGDDWIDLNTVEDLLGVIQNYNSEIACCSFIFEDIEHGRQRFAGRKFSPYVLAGRSILSAYLRGNDLYASVCGRMYKTSFLKKYNFYFDTDMSIGEDGYFSLQLMSKANSIVVTGYPCYHISVRFSSTTRNSIPELKDDTCYKDYLISENLWFLFKEEYMAWYIRAATSMLFHLALKTSCKNYSMLYTEYVKKTNYLKYNKFYIRKKLNARNHILSFLGKGKILSYTVIHIINVIKKGILR